MTFLIQKSRSIKIKTIKSISFISHVLINYLQKA